MTKNLTADQKVDLVLEKLTSLDSKVSSLDSRLSSLDSKVSSLDLKVDRIETKVDKMQGDITDLIELSSKAMNLAAVTSDRLDKLESKKSFTNFTKGAFVA